ncbi:MAG TPA: hypothetical protein VHX66_10220 [Solirubrobacteraceae bacterium]|jgi:type II secretory pathway pseudopilin PulG|nr:hypothetical protein [Solirubrobacteraceae bacterium]
MSLERTWASRGASLRGRVLACLRAERGDTLIEVLVAALMVALIATASLGGFADVGKLSETQRNEEQAATLAQQDQARLRGLTITQLASTGTGTGNTASNPPTTTIDGTTFKVVSAAVFISGSTGSSACTGSNGADEVQTTSTVTWGQNFANGGRNPVVVHGLITPAEGGALVVGVTDPTGAGLAGTLVSLSGPTAVSPVTTDSSGCVVWTGLATGSYTVSYTVPSGTWIMSNGNAPANQTVSVTAAATTHTSLQIGQAASIQAAFSTNWTGTPVTNESDTFELFDTTGTSPTTKTYGTDSTKGSNTYASSISTSTNLYPYAATPASNDYDAYAGGCTADDPGRTNDPGFTLTAGQVNTITIPEPALIVDVYGNTYDDPASSQVVYSTGWTHTTGGSNAYNGTESTTSTKNSTVTVTFTGTGITWIGTKGTSSTYGTAAVTVDGTSKGNFPTSFNGSGTTYQQALYSITGLTNTTHTLVLTATTASRIVSVDAFNVPGSPALETIAPTVSVTDDNTGCGSNVDYPPTVTNETAAQGALQFPGEIYGNLLVCADNGTYKNTAGTVASPIANTSFTSGKVVTINLYDGASGRASGTC